MDEDLLAVYCSSIFIEVLVDANAVDSMTVYEYGNLGTCC